LVSGASSLRELSLVVFNEGEQRETNDGEALTTPQANETHEVNDC
jgi:hypothetical protein